VKKPAPLAKKQGATSIEKNQQRHAELAKPIKVISDSLNFCQELAEILQQVRNLFKVLAKVGQTSPDQRHGFWDRQFWVLND